MEPSRDGSLRAPSPAPGDRNTFRPRHERAPSFTSRPPSFTSRASPGRANDDAVAAAAAPALVKHGGGSATSGRPQGTSLQAFKTEESVDAYLTNLAHELSMIAEQPTTIFKSQAVDPVESLTQALEVLDATVGTLSDVQSRAMRHVSFLSEEMNARERTFVGALDATEAAMDKSGADFRAMDGATSGLVASATTTGARLASAHRVTESARTTLGMLQHMWDFSNVKISQSSGGALALSGSLDPLFTDDTRLSDAATLVTTMLALARDVHSSNRRLGLASEELEGTRAGTVEAALRNLIAYRNQLENRLAKRFMDACQREPCDLRYMAKCCRNLQHFGAEGVAVKSYIAMMPLFTRQDAIYTPLPWTVGGQSEARTYALQQVLDELLDVVRHEREVFSRVFQKWEEALETMVVRVVEEKVEQAVSAALAPPDTSLFGELSDQIRVLDLYLQTLKPMHVLLRDFCASVRATLPASAAAASASLEGLLTILQANYPSAEQLWLSLQWRAFHEEARPNSAREGSDAGGPAAAVAAGGGSSLEGGSSMVGPDAGPSYFGKAAAVNYFRAGVAAVKARMGPADDGSLRAQVSPEVVAAFIAWHEVTIRRACDLLPAAAAAKHVAAFFHKKVPDLPPSCLLNQVVTHALDGIAAASRRAAAGFKQPYAVSAEAAARARLSQAAVAEAAEACMAAGPRSALVAVASCEAVVAAVQRHFSHSVLPHLSQSDTTAGEATAALSQLSQVLERSIEGALESLLEGFEACVARTLAAEQKKADFQPPDIDADRLDRPTAACQMVVGLVKALRLEVTEQLRGLPCTALLAEVGVALKEALTAHMLRFRYNDFGALQLKRDASEYQAAAAGFGIARVNDLFEQSMQLANLLIVPPSSLPDVLETSLQADRGTARKLILLRDDYATARVGGKPLAAVLGDAPAAYRPPGASMASGGKAAAVAGAAAMRSWMGRGGGGEAHT